MCTYRHLFHCVSRNPYLLFCFWGHQVKTIFDRNRRCKAVILNAQEKNGKKKRKFIILQKYYFLLKREKKMQQKRTVLVTSYAFKEFYKNFIYFFLILSGTSHKHSKNNLFGKKEIQI